MHILGLSILSGSHVPLIREVMQRLRAAGLANVPVVAGGIIPQDDVNVLKQLGVTAVYTPKDFDLNRIMGDLVSLIEKRTRRRHEAVCRSGADRRSRSVIATPSMVAPRGGNRIWRGRRGWRFRSCCRTG